jgi:hypothetical protein
VALPNSRGYELVSPLYKGGYGVATIAAASPSGNSLAFSSLGSFAGSPGGPSLQNGYLAGRHTSGWVTSPLEVPAAITPEAWGSELSPTLESEVVLTKPGPNAGAALRVGTEMRFWRHQTNSPDSGDGWEAAGPALEAVNGEPFSSIEGGANATLTHVLVGLATAPLLTQAENTERQLYDVVVGRGEAPALRLVGVDNEGKAIDAYCPVKPIPSAEQGSMFNDISADGSEIFFATNVEPAQQINCVGNPGNPVQVFARLGGARTIEISRPLGPCARNGVPGEVPCDGAASRAPAIFQGAREDGSTVFFTTTAALTGGTDESTNLYVARIGCPPAEEGCDASKREVTALTKLSQVGNPVEGADVQGVVRVAPDGSRAYFVARGVLSAAPNAEGRVALKGADNLYVVDSGSGNITFVSELCSGSAVSGVVSTMACPVELTAGALGRNDSTLWLGNGEGHASEAQTAGASGA